MKKFFLRIFCKVKTLQFLDMYLCRQAVNSIIFYLFSTINCSIKTSFLKFNFLFSIKLGDYTSNNGDNLIIINICKGQADK